MTGSVLTGANLTGAAITGLVSMEQLGSDIDGEAAGVENGACVALSSDGTIVAISAPYGDSNDSDNNKGHVRIYQRDTNNTNVEPIGWSQLGSDIDGEADNDYSGWSVALSSDGTIVAIGARLNDGNSGANSGHVRIYRWDEITTTWNQLGSDIDGEVANDWSGRSVALSSDGTIVAIGAIHNNGNSGADSGHVRIYEWTNNAWTQLGSDIDGEAAGDQSGRSVALSSDGTIVAIGAWINNGNSGAISGHVRIYGWDEITTTWTQLGSDIDGEADYDQSGISVALSSNGTTVAIGANHNDGNGTWSGHVRIYKRDTNNTNVEPIGWSQLGEDIDGEADGDNSGYSVALSSDGTIVAIGAVYNDGNGANSGHVRIYRWNEITTTWNQLGLDIDGEAGGDYSGQSVALSSDGTICCYWCEWK